MKLTRLAASGMSLLLIAGTGFAAVANAPVIGMTSGQGGVVDNSKVAGSATLFDGSTVQTKDYSRIHLNNGTRLDLGSDSQAQIFANRVSLQNGATEVQSASGYEIDAQTLKIRLNEATSIARVKLEGGNRVMVTALNGSVNVLNRDGMLVAKVNPGAPLSFLPQAAGATAFDNTGCVVQKAGAAILVDSTGNQIFELRGADLRKAVGNSVHIVGSTDSSATPAGGASAVVKVTSATITKKGGCSSVAAKIGATTTAAGLAAGVAGASAGGAAVAAGGAAAGAAGAAAGTAAAVGISTTAIVVGGVAAATAATVGGLAASGAIGGSSSP